MRVRQFALASALTAAAAGLGFAVSGAQAAAVAPPIVVKLIGFNDYHGTLQSPGTFGANTITATPRPAVGGAEYIAAYIARLKAQNPLNVVVGAGDFIGASPLISALFFDEPAVETLNKIGVEFNAVGNHEFDKGSTELKRLQSGGCKVVGGAPDPNSCKGFGSAAPGSFDGARFKWLSANVYETATGRTLLPPYGIKTFKGVKVAFIGMTLKGTPSIVTPTGVAGLEFRDEADTVNALVPRLRALGVEAIVVLVHQGGFQNLPRGSGAADVNVSDINACLNNLRSGTTPSDIETIVSRLDDAVDLVVSGHTHAAYNCSPDTVDVIGTRVPPTGSPFTVVANTSTPRPTGLPNKIGRLIPVTSASAFGRVVTDIDITIDPRTRNVVSVSPTNRLVDRSDPAIVAAIAADPSVKNVVDAYNAAVSPLANTVIATVVAPLTNAANGAGEMAAGSLFADAQLMATRPAVLGGAVVAFMNAGGVRSPGFVNPASPPPVPAYPYDVTYGNAFTVQPFGNSLVTMTLSAQQIKDLLEQQFIGCLGQTAQRIMQVSNGLRYAWSASAPACSKIVDVTFTPTDVSVVPPVVTGPSEAIVLGGVVQSPLKTYRVTVNNFMATGGDGFSVLLGGTAVQGGAQDIDALVAYLAGYKAPNPPYDQTLPALGVPRISVLP